MGDKLGYCINLEVVLHAQKMSIGCLITALKDALLCTITVN